MGGLDCGHQLAGLVGSRGGILGLLAVMLVAAVVGTTTAGQMWMVRNTPLRKAWMPAPSFRGWYVQPTEDALFNPARPANYTVQFTEEGKRWSVPWQSPPRRYDCPRINNASTITILLNMPAHHADAAAAAAAATGPARFRHVHAWDASDSTTRHAGALDRRPRRPEDVYALENVEPPINYPEFLSAEQVSQFDLDVGYRPRAASVLQLYLPGTLPDLLAVLRVPPAVPWSGKTLATFPDAPILVAVQQLRHHFGPSLRDIWGPFTAPPTRRVLWSTW